MIYLEKSVFAMYAKKLLGKLKAKPQFTVYQQYLREIYERRRNLIPKMKELKRQKHTVKLVYDKLK
jgi:hypothetical protein